MAIFNENETDEFTRWTSSKFKDPIAVEHGIRLNLPSGANEQMWWSKRWLSIIEAFGLGIRLQRAKMYATRGQVLSINIDNGIVRASVQGSDDQPYRVIIAVKTIPPAIWKAILQDFAGNSHFGICLASGRLPEEEELEAVFRANGVLLFPDRQGEMQTKCTCLDWSNPCKHIAAVYLLLAAEFNRDPFLIFKLRGLLQTDLFALLKPGETAEIESAQFMHVEADDHAMQGESAIAFATEQFHPSDSNLPGRTHIGACDPRNFWMGSPTIDELIGPWQPAAETGTLPASLGEFPFWQGKHELLTAIRVAYQMAPDQATRLFASASDKLFD